MNLLERIRGCLLGGAVGDAMGYAVEFMLLEQIRRQYGDAGIQDMPLQVRYAPASDDTQMTLFTCEGIVMGWNRAVHGGLAADMEVYVHDAYLNWLGTQGRRAQGMWKRFSTLMPRREMHALRAPGNTCLSALASGKMGTLAEPLNDSCGCGGVMRVAPVGFVLPFGRRYDDCPEDAAAWIGAKVACITHGHPLGYMPSAMLADLIRLIALEDGRSLEEMANEALERTGRLLAKGEETYWAQFEDIMRRAMSLSHEEMDDVEAIRSLGEGWTGHEALAIALYCALKHENDFAACIRAAVNHDGDSDSTGAIAGNILGAYKGVGVIPQEWIEKVDLRDACEDMAKQLHDVAVEQRQ